jgi:predicted dehydrogenase
LNPLSPGWRKTNKELKSKMIRVGVIGCGGIARVHESYLSNLAPLGRLTALADIDLERAKAAAEKLDGVKAAADYRDIYNHVDAVLLSLPHHLHYPIGMDFLRAGKHVLMEKPLANKEEECLELIDTAKKNNLTLMTAYCMRYHPLVEKMGQLLRDEYLGRVFSVSIWTEQYTYQEEGRWGRSAEKLGGGQLFSHGCHYIDILLSYLGDPVEGTHTGTNYCTPWMEREGTSHVAMKFKSGAVAYHFGTWGAKGSRLRYSFHAHCEKGMLEINIAEGKLISIVEGKETILAECTPGSKYLQNEMMHFLSCVNTGNRPLTDGPKSLQSLRVIWKLYEAEEKGVVANLTGLGLGCVE